MKTPRKRVSGRKKLAAEALESRQMLTTCIDFEGLPLGQNYSVGDSFVADNTGFSAIIQGQPFGGVGGGFARVENANLAGHVGQDLQVNNISLDFNFQQPVNDGLTMNFGEYGGFLEMELNGTFNQFQDFADLDGMIIGGTQISVVNGFGQDRGVLSIDGAVNSFAIGGQELWIDHVCLAESTQEPRLDFGDAPDLEGSFSYNTLIANDGAFHVVDDVHFLGDGVDRELDGQPNLPATGDDIAGIPDDEDGVVFLTPIVPGQDARVQVTASEDGFLSAWMDFGRDGKWDGSDKIFSTEFLPPGTHVLSFPVPNDAEVGATYSRWRFTDAQLDLSPESAGNDAGEPLNGEVEDYRNNIERPDDQECIDFEHLPLGSVYLVGDNFVADPTGFSANFRGEPFTFSGGGTTAAGQAVVDNSGSAGHLGQDVAVNNILLSANFGGAIPGLTMNFGEFGGNLNVEINGDFRNVQNFIDLDGMVIGGTMVTVPAGGFGNDQGVLVVDGVVNSFKFGGQELWVDHICQFEGQGEDELDWGDAPDSPNGPQYNTLMANRGAVHSINNVHFLGDRVDAELDGQPTLGADGDDSAAADDEDGIRFLSPLVPGKPTDVEVTANADGFLNAWVDFNRDGTWNPSDQIFSVQFVPAGTHVLSFHVPAVAESGTTYSRWRFTDVQNPIGPEGFGSALGLIDGEVEDYRGRILVNTDFDQDGDCDCDDVNAMVNNIASGVYDANMDLNNDGLLDTDDLNIWLNDAALKNGLPSAYLPGDANLDGVVDVSDFNAWNANKFTSGAGWCGGDFNADGVVDVSDFNIWNSNKFTSSSDAAIMANTPSDTGTDSIDESQRQRMVAFESETTDLPAKTRLNEWQASKQESSMDKGRTDDLHEELESRHAQLADLVFGAA